MSDEGGDERYSGDLTTISGSNAGDESLFTELGEGSDVTMERSTENIHLEDEDIQPDEAAEEDKRKKRQGRAIGLGSFALFSKARSPKSSAQSKNKKKNKKKKAQPKKSLSTLPDPNMLELGVIEILDVVEQAAEEAPEKSKDSKQGQRLSAQSQAQSSEKSSILNGRNQRRDSRSSFHSVRSMEYRKEARLKAFQPVSDDIYVQRKNKKAESQLSEDEEIKEIERTKRSYFSDNAVVELFRQLKRSPKPPPEQYPRDGTGSHYAEQNGFDGKSDQEHIVGMEQEYQRQKKMLETLEKMKRAQKEREETEKQNRKRQPRKCCSWCCLCAGFCTCCRGKSPKTFAAKGGRKKKIDFPAILALLSLVFTVITLCVYFGTGANLKEENKTSLETLTPTIAPDTTQTTTPTFETASPVSAPIPATTVPTFSPNVPTLLPTTAPSLFPTRTPSAFPTASPESIISPTGVPTTFSSNFPTRSPTVDIEVLEGICAGTSGNKERVGICIDEDHFAQCDEDGNVLESFRDCHIGIKCECPPFIRVTDRNPCSAQSGNSCEEDI